MMKGEGDGRRGRRGARRTRAPGTRGNRCGPSEGVGGCGRLEAARRPGGGLSQNRLPHAGSGCGATGAATWQPKSGAALGPPLRGLSAGSPGRSPPVLEPGVKPTPGLQDEGREAHECGAGAGGSAVTRMPDACGRSCPCAPARAFPDAASRAHCVRKRGRACRRAAWASRQGSVPPARGPSVSAASPLILAPTPSLREEAFTDPRPRSPQR